MKKSERNQDSAGKTSGISARRWTDSPPQDALTRVSVSSIQDKWRLDHERDCPIREPMRFTGIWIRSTGAQPEVSRRRYGTGARRDSSLVRSFAEVPPRLNTHHNLGSDARPVAPLWPVQEASTFRTTEPAVDRGTSAGKAGLPLGIKGVVASCVKKRSALESYFAAIISVALGKAGVSGSREDAGNRNAPEVVMVTRKPLRLDAECERRS